MADVTITNLDERVLAALKRYAKARNRSLQAELRDAVRNHAAGLRVGPADRRTDLRPVREPGDL